MHCKQLNKQNIPGHHITYNIQVMIRQAARLKLDQVGEGSQTRYLSESLVKSIASPMIAICRFLQSCKGIACWEFAQT